LTHCSKLLIPEFQVCLVHFWWIGLEVLNSVSTAGASSPSYSSKFGANRLKNKLSREGCLRRLSGRLHRLCGGRLQCTGCVVGAGSNENKANSDKL
jgi:hypothetical protein